jgi:3-hydroxyisobutyrate dehydrogenase-like beta-hydroxyacid dehydrogenase
MALPEGSTALAGRRAGVIGYGVMGEPVAAHFARAGATVAVYDVSAERMAVAAAAGHLACASPAEVAKSSDEVFIIVGFDEEVERACFGPGGVAEEAGAHTTLVVCSTVTPATMVELTRRLAPIGAKVVDAPMIRGGQAAKDATMLLTVGGERETVASLQPYLDAIGSDVCYLGGAGAGQVGKALNNFLLWTSNCAAFEVFDLCDAYGIEREAMADALNLGSGVSRSLRDYLGGGATYRWAEKDMTIVSQMSDERMRSMPLAGVVKEEIKAVKIARGKETPHPVRPL